MKGIILAGGTGTRLFPITEGISKHLLAIYDKPMIYYPISVLMLAGIREILIITTEEDIDSYQRLLMHGENFGLNIQFAIQNKPEGLAQAFIIGEEFINNDNCCLILGDNIFYGQHFSGKLLEASSNSSGATLFAYEVLDPSRFGIIEFTGNKILSIEEKPSNPKSNFAVTGLYFYDKNVVNYAKQLIPSKRGELEITDLNNIYLQEGKLNVSLLGRGFTWLDTGTHASLLEAAQFVHTVEKHQGHKIACLEEIAYKKGWIDSKTLLRRAKLLANTEYGKYLRTIL